MLSKADINKEIGYGELEIDYDSQSSDKKNASECSEERTRNADLSVEPSSIDLHLGHMWGYYEEQKQPIEVWNKETYPEYHEIDTRDDHTTDYIEIQPGEFLLAHTQEVVNLPNYLVGKLEGRSSLGRLTVFVENAGLVDAGFWGDLTLELYNSGKNTVRLPPEMRAVQMTLYEHDQAPNIGYSRHNNKYQGQRGPTPSKLYEDFS